MQHITCFHQQNKPKIIEIDQKMTELQLFKGVQILLGVCITMHVTKVQLRVGVNHMIFDIGLMAKFRLQIT